MSLNERPSSASSRGPVSGRARRGRLPRRSADAARSRSMRAGDRAAEHERWRRRRRRPRRGDGEDLDVVAHVEHDPAREQHDGERQQDGEQREPGQLQPDRREEPEPDGRGEADREGDERDDEREPDHGTNR